jgi:enoyl-CoA hydratase
VRDDVAPIDPAGDEIAVAARIVTQHDFAEGVRAVLVEKDNAPAWNPDTPKGVTQDMLDGIFAPMPAGEEWTPIAA